MLALYRVLAFIGCLAALAWVLVERNKFDPWIALAAALTVLVSSFLSPVARRLRRGMSQDVGAHGIGIQAGRDAQVSLKQRPPGSHDV